MSTPSIFIVEDESIIAEDLCQRIQNMGYKVVGTAATGTEAYTQALALEPNLVLMDIVLRGQPNGIEAARRIRADSEIPIVFLTAHSDPQTVSMAATAAPMGYLLKPIDDSSLRVALEVALVRHASEPRRSQAENWLAAAMHSIGDAVVATDRDGRITYANPSASELLGHQSSEVHGRLFRDVFHLRNGSTCTVASDPVTRALAEGQVVHVDRHTVLARKDGTEVYVDDSAAPLLDDDGRVIGVVGVFRDSTEREKVLRDRIDAHERSLQNLAARSRDPTTSHEQSSEQARSLFQDLYGSLKALHYMSRDLSRRMPRNVEPNVRALADDLREYCAQVCVAAGLFAGAVTRSGMPMAEHGTTDRER